MNIEPEGSTRVYFICFGGGVRDGFALFDIVLNRREE
jgi:hypothetical protein